MKGIDGGYKLTELLFGREDSVDAIVNVTAESRKTLEKKINPHGINERFSFN